jgi:hypothetical protein
MLLLPRMASKNIHSSSILIQTRTEVNVHCRAYTGRVVQSLLAATLASYNPRHVNVDCSLYNLIPKTRRIRTTPCFQHVLPECATSAPCFDGGIAVQISVHCTTTFCLKGCDAVCDNKFHAGYRDILLLAVAKGAGRSNLL